MHCWPWQLMFLYCGVLWHLYTQMSSSITCLILITVSCSRDSCSDQEHGEPTGDQTGHQWTPGSSVCISFISSISQMFFSLCQTHRHFWLVTLICDGQLQLPQSCYTPISPMFFKIKCVSMIPESLTTMVSLKHTTLPLRRHVKTVLGCCLNFMCARTLCCHMY